ncbi:hypothetical protein B7764_24300 (plasmid) [Pantoea ananatis]|nr:hypothetical protein B7764_24300 [Pantoea ananatis]
MSGLINPFSPDTSLFLKIPKQSDGMPVPLFRHLLFHLLSITCTPLADAYDLTDLTMTLNDMPDGAFRAQTLIAHRQKTL